MQHNHKNLCASQVLSSRLTLKLIVAVQELLFSRQKAQKKSHWNWLDALMVEIPNIFGELAAVLAYNSYSSLMIDVSTMFMKKTTKHQHNLFLSNGANATLLEQSLLRSQEVWLSRQLR